MRIDDYPAQEAFSGLGAAYHADVMRRGAGIEGLDFTHGPDPYQGAVVYPAGKPTGDVLVFMHGGGWTNGYKEWMAFMAPGLNAAGVTLVSVGYRLAPAHLFPAGVEDAMAGLAWVWFVNLFNFMDGIDGIAGVETASIGLGLAAIGLLAPAAGGDPGHALGLAAAALGFLWWNWHPAKIFLGDVGSVPIGFLLGWLLLTAAANGWWAPALILPLYYLVDATATLLRRATRREKVWRAHREHFYQYAVQQGRSHAQVSGVVAIANAALIGLAMAAMHAPLPALAGAAIVVALLLLWMRR